MTEILWVLDAGHGGMIDGVYQTSGKRSPKWEDGKQLFEGEFNRDVVSRIESMCIASGIPCVVLVPEQEDVSLSERVCRAKEINENSDIPVVYLSVHANAGGGTGWEVFTSPGQTKSDLIATVFAKHAAKLFPEFRMRTDKSDGDVDKESKFYVLVKTPMPAILTENFFMDTEYPDCRLLLTDHGRERIAKLHFNAMLEIQQKGY
mgnify:CR=1 FL=1